MVDQSISTAHAWRKHTDMYLHGNIISNQVDHSLLNVTSQSPSQTSSRHQLPISHHLQTPLLRLMRTSTRPPSYCYEAFVTPMAVFSIRDVKSRHPPLGLCIGPQPACSNLGSIFNTSQARGFSHNVPRAPALAALCCKCDSVDSLLSGTVSAVSRCSCPFSPQAQS